MRPEERRARAYAARALMEDPTLQAGWQQIENEIIEQWTQAGRWGEWASRKERDRLWIELRAIRALRQKLASFAGQARD